MILKGSQRAGAKQLAAHLLNDRDNDHVEVLELSGFVSEELRGAFREVEAISKATRCKQYLFSLSLSPPKQVVAGEEDFRDAADRAEQALGLDGQPRAIIIHEKEGRRHAHVVWSRIDAAQLKAINLPHFKNKLTGLSKELYLDHGWDLPDGLRLNSGKSFLNFTLDEWQQAKRQDIDPREIKASMREAWERTDSLRGLSNALEERGYYLAQGDRRGFVALDVHGNVYALPRWLGLKSKEVKDRLGSPNQLPSVDVRKAELKTKVTDKLRDFLREAKDRQSRAIKPLNDERAVLVQQHRQERERLRIKQNARAEVEAKERASRLRKGLSGLFDRLTGRARQIREQNAAEAFEASKRDQKQRDDLAVLQMEDRRSLQGRFDHLRNRHKDDRRLLAREVMQFLRVRSRGHETADREQSRSRSEEPSRPRPGSRDRGPRFEL